MQMNGLQFKICVCRLRRAGGRTGERANGRANNYVLNNNDSKSFGF